MNALEAQRVAAQQVIKLRERAAQFIALMDEIKTIASSIRKAQPQLTSAALNMAIDTELEKISAGMVSAITSGVTWRTKP